MKSKSKKQFLQDLKQWYWNQSGYKPHLGQIDLHECDSRFIIAVCGRRWGKTLAAAKEIEVQSFLPNQRIWVVAPTYNLASKVFRVVWDNLVIKGYNKVIKKSISEKMIVTESGSVIECKSADNPDSLVGEGLDFLVIDEAAKTKKFVWEKYLRPTLSDRQGKALFITTPEGHNWIHELWKRGHEKKQV